MQINYAIFLFSSDPRPQLIPATGFAFLNPPWSSIVGLEIAGTGSMGACLLILMLQGSRKPTDMGSSGVSPLSRDTPILIGAADGNV